MPALVRWRALGRDLPADPEHVSAYHMTELTTEDPQIGSVRGEPQVRPAFTVAALRQHYREAQPRVALIHGDRHQMILTLAEAAELGTALAELAREGRKGAA